MLHSWRDMRCLRARSPGGYETVQLWMHVYEQSKLLNCFRLFVLLLCHWFVRALFWVSFMFRICEQAWLADTSTSTNGQLFGSSSAECWS